MTLYTEITLVSAIMVLFALTLIVASMALVMNRQERTMQRLVSACDKAVIAFVSSLQLEALSEDHKRIEALQAQQTDNLSALNAYVNNVELQDMAVQASVPSAH